MRYSFETSEQCIADQVGESQLVSVVWFSIRICNSLFILLDDRDCRIACCSCRILYAEHTVISLTVTEIRLDLRLPDWEVPSPPVEVTEQQEGEVNGA